MKKRLFICGAALLSVLSLAAIGAAVNTALLDINRFSYTRGCSRDDVRDALFAAYLYGQGRETYGADDPAPAEFPRPWGRQADEWANRIVRQPWFDAYRKAFHVFATEGMTGFLDAFNRSVMNDRVFLSDRVFNELAQSEHLDVTTPRGYQRAVARYFVLLGYDRRLTTPAACFSRLLIGYFTAPAEAYRSVDSVGMDKFTHYYHAREAAERYGITGALICGLGVEMAEFFMGHHHAPLLLRTFSDWDNFIFRWKGGWPRVYPSRKFFEANVSDFMAGEITYDQWISLAPARPFGWGDLVANWQGAFSARLSFIDLAGFCLLASVAAWAFLARRRFRLTSDPAGSPGQELTPVQTR